MEKKGVFGIASSLMILSAEENTKFYGLVVNGINRSENFKELRKYFYDHKHKHSSATMFFTLMNIVEEMKDEINLAKIESVNQSEKVKKKVFKKLIEKSLLKEEENDNYFNSIFDWEENADVIKKNGFYVDWNEGNWHSPSYVDEVTYIKVRDKALYILRHLQYMAENISLDEFLSKLSSNVDFKS